MKAKLLAISVLLIFLLLSPIIGVYAQNIQYINTSFENEPSPQQCFWDGYTPSPFGGDIGDGEFTNPDVSTMWVIDSSDDPQLGRLPPSFVDGDKVVYGNVMPDPDWSTECFLLYVIVDTTEFFYISWYQAFDPLPSGSDYLPIFWDYVRKVRVSDGQTIQYTVPVIRATLSGNAISIAAHGDANVDLTGASTTSFPIQASTWYKFEFWHIWDETAGEITFKIDDTTVFSFTGDTVAKTLDSETEYTPIHGFEVGMQYPALASSTVYSYWIDNIVAGNHIIPEFPTEFLLLLLVPITLIVIVVGKKALHWTQRNQSSVSGINVKSAKTMKHV